MTAVNTKHPPATIQCVAAFTKWYGMSVCDDMDIQTEVAWDHWQHAWNASKLDSDREQAENATPQAATAPLLARIAELEAKLAEAQKDAARLDYVATGKVTVSRDNGGFQLAWYDHNSQKLKWQNSWHETARAAIDAALAAEERAHGITED